MHHLIAVLSILVLFAAAATSDAVQPIAGEAYWSKVLPNTPMPRSIKDLLIPADHQLMDGKSNVGTLLRWDTGYSRRAYGGTLQKWDTGYSRRAYGETLQKWDTGYSRRAYGGTLQKWDTGYSGHRNYGGRKSGDPKSYDPDLDGHYFFEKHLISGTNMTLRFANPFISPATFISREEADSIPFTSSKLSEILDHFSIDPHSIQGKILEGSLSECERPVMVGETKHCPTSLESMVDFSTSTLRTHNLIATSTSVEGGVSLRQSFNVVSSWVRSRVTPGKTNLVVCHTLPYTHAVFYCHAIEGSEAYGASLVGEDGTRVEAVAVCHTDTSQWSPEHAAFRMLGIKPGTIPICHFLEQDTVAWIPQAN